MLIDEMKKRMFAAMKAQDTVEKEILRTAIGEVTRAGEEATDERVVGVLRKIGKGCQETLGHAQDPAQRATLEREIAILESLLPKGLGPEEIRALLAPVQEAIAAATGEGQAIGLAMKHLKASGVSADGGSVAAAVRLLRG